MQDRNNNKMPLYEGADGKLYYNFANGLKVAMHGSDRDKSEDYELEIVGCHYIGNTEYYDVLIHGAQLPQPISANRVKYLVSRYGVKTLINGERQELPLTVDEVKSFYEFREWQRAKVQSEASRITEYAALKLAVVGLTPKIGMAQAYGRTNEAAALTEQRSELERRAADVLKAHGIDPATVAEPAPCSECGGRGYIFNYVCECALPHTQEIKTFCASERLRLRTLTRRQ